MLKYRLVWSCLWIQRDLEAGMTVWAPKFGPQKSVLEGVYTWNFIRGWNSSPDETIPVYGEMSLTVYTFLLRWNFTLGWTHPCQKDRWNFIAGWNRRKKEEKKRFILWLNFEMSIRIYIFWLIYSNMLSKVNVLNIIRVLI